MAGRISYYGGIVTNGLVFDSDAAKKDSYPGSGTAWRDVYNSKNGTLLNGPTFNQNNGGSVVFDGVDDYVEFGLIPEMSNLLNITVTYWYYPTTTNATKALGGRYNNLQPTGSPSGLNNGWHFLYTSGGIFYFAGRESGASYLSILTPTSYPINNWYNVVGTKQGSLWSLYVNGILRVSGNRGTGTIPFYGNDLQIGALKQGIFGVNQYVGNYVNGRISQSLMYNRALSATEVLQNYNATKGRYGL